MALLANDSSPIFSTQPGVRTSSLPETMSQDDPWAWLNWAQQRQPDIYGWDTIQGAADPFSGGPAWWAGPVAEGADPHATMTPEQARAMAAAGYTWNQARGPGYANLWQLKDKDGNVIDKGGFNRTQSMHGEDYAMYAAVLAAALGGTLYGGAGAGGEAAAAGAAGGADAATSAAWANGAGLGMDTVGAVGGGSAAGGAGGLLATGGADAATSAAWANGAGLGMDTVGAVGGSSAGSLAPLAGIEGMGVTVPETYAGSATLAESGALSPELQAIAAGGSMAGGTVPAGYGTYTGATTGAGGLLGDAASWAAQNPKVVGAVVGGLAGTGGGGSSGGSGGGGGSSGPAPTITRGNWSPSATPQYMQTPTFGGQLPTTGNANSGLWRYASPQANQPQTSLLPAPQGASLLGQPQQSLLPPANQTQWQQPTGPTFNMSGQQLNQGSAMTQPKQPTQTTQSEPAGTPWAGTGGAPAAANYTWGGDGERQLAYNKGQDMLPAGVKNAADANAQGWYQARDAADGQWVWTKAGQMKAYDTTGMQMQSNGYGTLIPKHSANTNGFTGAPMPAQGLLGTATTQDRYNPNNKV